MTDIFSPEKNIVGCILMGDNAGEIFGELSADDFRDEDWRIVFQKLRKRWELDGKITPEVIANYPPQHKEMAVFSMNTLPSVSGWKVYAAQVREGMALAKSQSIALQIAANGMDIDEIQAKVNELAQIVNFSTTTESLSMFDGIQAFMREKSSPKSYIKTGFSMLDKYTYIDGGDFVVIGGRPSSGKTALSLSLALNMARQGLNVAYFSLETSPQKIMDRLITTFCELDFGRVKRQELGDEWEKVANLCEDLGEYPIEIIKASGKTAAWIQSEAVRRKADIAVIDYIGLIKSDGASRYEKMTNISMDLHNFAQQTGVVVIGLSQLNRGGAGHEPCMEDIRESGQVEQDADVILLLHNTQEYDAYGNMRGEYKIIIAKNKEGETGDVPMYFDGRRQRFNVIVA